MEGFNKSEISLILSNILSQQFVQNISIPNVVMRTFYDFQNNNNGQLFELSQKVGIGMERLQYFFNQSAQCSKIVRNEIPQMSIFTGVTFVDKLRIQW